jgi:hypothetical protein
MCVSLGGRGRTRARSSVFTATSCGGGGAWTGDGSIVARRGDTDRCEWGVAFVMTPTPRCVRRRPVGPLFRIPFHFFCLLLCFFATNDQRIFVQDAQPLRLLL